jgi:hypothetical protein
MQIPAQFVTKTSTRFFSKLQKRQLGGSSAHVLNCYGSLKFAIKNVLKFTYEHIGFQKCSRGLYPRTPVKKGGQGREGGQGTGRKGEWNRKGGKGTGRKGNEKGEEKGRGRERRGGSLVLTPLLFSDNSHTANALGFYHGVAEGQGRFTSTTF